MLFNSYAFILLYLPITLLVYYGLACFRRVRAATAWLVFASFFFYGYWDVRYVPLLFGSICWNYWFGKRIESTARKRIPLTIAVSGNIALLAYFKYTGFFLETINAVRGFSYDIPHIVLPLGISFFTFTQTAYLVDVYRGETRKSGGDIPSLSVVCDDLPAFDCRTDYQLPRDDAAICAAAEFCSELSKSVFWVGAVCYWIVQKGLYRGSDCALGGQCVRSDGRA